jgi:polyisoprenoid-binding protein YceI
MMSIDMMPVKLISLLLAGVAVLFAGSAQADMLSEAAGNYDIRPSSHIAFSVAQVGGGGIRGDFGRFSGVFRINASHVGRSQVEFTLFPESVRTGQARVERFLRSDAVFDVAQFPEITFRSTGVAQTSATSARIDGVLTARGTTRPASFTAQLQERGSGSISFHVTGDVLRSPFGMDVGTPIYSNVVHFDMTLRGERR